MKYTKKIHVERLRKMLKRKKPCDLCPAIRHYGAGESVGFAWSNKRDEVCKICQDFVINLDYEEAGCPCRALGQEEALKRTYLALEKED